MSERSKPPFVDPFADFEKRQKEEQQKELKFKQDMFDLEHKKQKELSAIVRSGLSWNRKNE